MALTYSTLTGAKTVSGSIANWINRADLPVADILTEAEAWLVSRLRVREMLSFGSVTITSGTSSAALPSDFLDAVQLLPNGATQELPLVAPSVLGRRTSAGGAVEVSTPTRWAVIGTAAHVDVACATTFESSLIYYARPAALSSDNPTNFLTTRYPTAVRLVCMAFGYQFMKDEREAAAFKEAEVAIAAANAESENERKRQRAARPASATISYETLVGDMELSGSIRNMIGRADISAEYILTEAQSWLYERMRVREMLAAAELSIASGQSSGALPGDYLDPVQWLPYGATAELPFVAPTAIAKSTSALGVVQSGTPGRWTAIGSSAHVNVAPTSTYSGTLTYYARPAALSAGNPANFLTTRHPTALRLVCMAFSYQMIGDAKATAFFADAEQAVQVANAAAEKDARNQRAARAASAAFSYTTLVDDQEVAGSIRNMIGRRDISVDLILAEALSWIYQRLRAREMLAAAPLVFSEGEESAALPSDFLDPVQFVPANYGTPLPYMHEAMPRVRDDDGMLPEGTPSQWTIIGSTAYVDTTCDADFSGQLLYYARPSALSANNPTNFVTDRYPTLLRRALMMRAAEHIGDRQAAGEWMAVAEVSIQEAAASNEMFRRSQYLPF